MKPTFLFPVLALAPLIIPLHLAAGEFTLGAGAYTSKSAYIGFKDNSGPMPIIEYQAVGWSAGTSGISVDLYGTEESPLSIAAILATGGESFDEGDSKHFKGMKKRKSSVDLGLALEYDSGPGTMSASILADVSSNHKGYVLDLGYTQAISVLGGLFQPSVGVEFLSANYTDYYYGVRASESTSTRKHYKAGNSVNPYIGYNYAYPVNKNIRVIHGTTLVYLGKDIKDSSLINRSNTWSTFLGIGYTF